MSKVIPNTTPQLMAATLNFPGNFCAVVQSNSLALFEDMRLSKPIACPDLCKEYAGLLEAWLRGGDNLTWDYAIFVFDDEVCVVHTPNAFGGYDVRTKKTVASKVAKRYWRLVTEQMKPWACGLAKEAA